MLPTSYNTSENSHLSEPLSVPQHIHHVQQLFQPWLHDHPVLRSLAETAQHYFSDHLAQSTVDLYERDWLRFEAWCLVHGLVSLPAEVCTVAIFMTVLAEQHRSLSTIKQYVAAIKAKHESHAHTSPTGSPVIKRILQGISRKHSHPAVGADALLPEILRKVLQGIDESRLIGKRNKALLLLGFAGAFRRSEIVGLNYEDVQQCEEGLIVTLRHSKTDQQGQGRLVGIPRGQHPETCPVLAVETWLLAAGITAGAIFRGMDRRDRIVFPRLSGRAVSQIIKRTAKSVGIETQKLSGHSLRAGHCTAAVRAGVPEKVIMRQTGHRSHQTMLKYIRLGTLFRENSASAMDL